MSKLTPVGWTLAAPGEIGYGLVDLQPGRCVAVCTIPVGSTPDEWPPSTDGEMAEPHLAHGMIQEFEVVATDSASAPETSGA